jgi:glutathione S-transferase
MLTIHNFPRGARGLRVMWLCEELGVPWRFSPVTFPPSDAYLALNPLGNVPFLEGEDGVAINESIAMLLYVAERHGPTPLLPARDDPALAKVLQLTVMSETAIGMAMNPLMAAKFGAPEEHRRNWSVGVLESSLERAVGFIETELGDNDYLVGGRLTVADMAFSTALGIWRGALGGVLSDRLAAYHAKLAARPAYQRAVAAMGA